MPRDGILFILVGPTAAGKNTLLAAALEQFSNLQQLATMTTREIRTNERQGREHWFVSQDEFMHNAESGALVEWQQVNLEDYYGTPRKTVNEAIAARHDLIADIEFLGAGKIQEGYPDNTVLIFISPSSLDDLPKRILGRGPISADELKQRLVRARFEMTFAPRCDYLVLNDSIPQAVDQLCRIISTERYLRRGEPLGDCEFMPRHVFHGRVIALIHSNGSLLMQTDGAGDPLPDFPLESRTQSPYEVLQQGIHRTFNRGVSIEAVSDSRFNFVAPNQVTLSAPLPDVFINYYYKCSFPEQISFPGWEWQPLTNLKLPASVGELVAP